MRFWLVIIAVVSLIGWSLYSSMHGKGIAVGIGEAVSKSALAAPKSLVPAAGAVPAPASTPATQMPTFNAPEPAPSPLMNHQPMALNVSRVVRLENRDLPDESTMAAVSTLGVQVVVDRNSRTVLLRGPVDAVEAASDLLKAIDLCQASCAVQTWAVFVDRKAQTGIDLVAAISATAGASTSANFGGGAFTLDLSADKVATALAVIADGSSVEVVQRPHVRLTHGTPARIESIQEVPVPTTSVSQGISQTSIDYRKVGLQLAVTPMFLSRDRVRLGVVQTNGLIGQNVKIANNDVPVISSQTVETTVEMTVGQTIVLGGVSTQRTRRVRGLLRNTEETDQGALYVILSTYHEEPKAIPVRDPELESPSPGVPMTTPLEPAIDWIDGEVLPPLLQKSSESK